MEGLLFGVATFALIGVFHPLVIKAEYYWGLKSIWAFVFCGIIFAFASYFVDQLLLSILLGITACCCFWSILEIRDQEKRVLKGWFPENPQRRDYYEKRRSELGQID